MSSRNDWPESPNSRDTLPETEERDTLPPPSMPMGKLTHEDLVDMFQANFEATNRLLETSLDRLEQHFAAALTAQTELLERAMMLAIDRTSELNQKLPAIEARLAKVEAELTLLKTAASV